jgi:hypothetical protein
MSDTHRVTLSAAKVSREVAQCFAECASETVSRSESEEQEKSTKLDNTTLTFSCNDWLNMLHYFLIELELGRVLYEN